jgi:hypothetical protein
MAHHKPRKNELRKEIAALIDSIKNQSDRIGTTRDVPQVDIDLIIHSIEQLHRKAVVFSYLNSLPETEEPEKPVVAASPATVQVAPVVAEVKTPEPVAPEPPKVEVVTAPVAEVKIPEPVVPEPPKVEVVTAPVAEVKIPEPEPIAPVAVPEPPKAEIVAPQVPEVKIPEPPKTDPAPQTAKPATGKDVRSMIGFNEKLMFLRNLFGGDAAAYDEALNHLNSTTSHDEADAFVSMLQREYRWQPESEPAEMFRNLVNRRFS